jgi:hypothetical protein
MLRVATVEEKQLILGLERDLALAIANIYQIYAIDTFEDIEIRLTIEQVKTLIDKFSGINQFQLNYFRKSRAERSVIIAAIKKLRLDEND